MNIDQIDIIDLSLKILSKSDWSYRLVPGPEDYTYVNGREAAKKIFSAIYNRELDKNTSGVHWLARTAILQAIAHTGFFRPRMGFCKLLFYIWSFVSTIVFFWMCYQK